MQLNIQIDDDLIQQATQFKHQTPQMVVLEALQEYVQRQKRLATIEEFGQYDFDPDYDYKAARKR